MSRDKLFAAVLISSFLLVGSVLSWPVCVRAAQADGGNAAIELSEEEADYCERAGEIVIGCPVENCPLIFQNEKTGELEGITIDILDMIAEETGLTLRYEALPAGGITYEDLQRLQVDLVASVESNDLNEKARGIAMTDPYLHAEKVFVCKRGEIFHLDSPMVIAVSTGSQTLEGIIRQQYPSFQILYCDSTEDALSAVLAGKADAALQNQYTIERILCKPIYENLQIVATASIGDSHCLGCLVPLDEDRQNIISEDTALLLSILNKGIAALDQSQISFLIIRETAENAYQFTVKDMLYRYRYAAAVLTVSLLMIVFLLRRNRILTLKRSEQLATEQRAKELAAINTRMKEQQLLLEDALKRAEEGNRAKTTFLFNMSHDIRTPMNAILGFAEIAQRSKDDRDKLTDSLDKIQASGRHLLQLLNDVLDMSKIETGQVTLTEECCNLEECIEKVRAILQIEMDKKNLSFRLDTSGAADKWVCCDSLRINQIMFNLLSNAIKFNRPGGSIAITLRQSPCDIREYAVYEIRVRDSGIGMSPEFLEHIFEPFEREHTSTVSQTQGTGLGMSITKNLVDLMGGSIRVSSEAGRGTEFILQFTFRLYEPDHLPGRQPIQQPGEQSEQPVPKEQQAPCRERQGSGGTAGTDAFSGRRLLLVEDNALNMEIAEELLCEAGFAVETAQNGQIAVEMVQSSAAGYYDAILMDIQMPVMDGYQASRRIRSLPDKNLARIPIIALTANAFDEDKKTALANGMNAHIAKPLDVGVLFETLQEVLKGKAE